jgi:hypothetical protein
MADSFKASLAQARKELDEVDTQLAELWMRKSNLNKLVKILEPMVPEKDGEPATELALEPASTPLVPPAAEMSPVAAAMPLAMSNRPLWEIVAHLMRGRGPFRIVDAALAVEEHIGRSLGENRSQLVRNGLINHTDTFRQNPDRRYEVVEERNQEAPKGAS